jgi:hypothetical protein
MIALSESPFLMYAEPRPLQAHDFVGFLSKAFLYVLIIPYRLSLILYSLAGYF